MPLLWILFAILIATAALFNSDQSAQNRATADAEVSAIAGSMLIYRNAVSAYAQAFPAFTGTVPDASLSLPGWYLKPPGLSNYLSAGKSYTYYSATLPGLAATIAGRTKPNASGFNTGGVLISPKGGNTGLALPAKIPKSSVVIIE